jgi:hypothetical protein
MHFFATASYPGRAPAKPLKIRYRSFFFHGGKLTGTEVKNARRYTSYPPYTFMAWCLIETGTHLMFYDICIALPSRGRFIQLGNVLYKGGKYKQI